MDWLNHHHLLYFWTVAREGSIARASKVLHLTPQTISSQLKELEHALDTPLFERRGRGLALTDAGETVRRYADEIFTISRELVDTVRGRPTGRPAVFRVGVADVIPRFVAHRILAPALHLPTEVRLECRSEGTDTILAKLALHQLDLVLADAPIPPATSIRAFNHLLGTSEIIWLGAPRLAEKLRPKFPQSLDGAPVVLPTTDTAFRREIDLWLDQLGVRPRVVAEFQDSGLLKTFGEAGEGAFPVPRVILGEVRRHYGVRLIGTATGVVQSYYAISVERRIRHPAVVAISRAAKRDLFEA